MKFRVAILFILFLFSCDKPLPIGPGLFDSDCALVGCGGWQIDLNNSEVFKIQHLPLIVYDNGIEGVFKESFTFTSKWDIYEIWVFMGLDPGDKVEFDTNIYIDRIPVILRSEHKETLVGYDAWGDGAWKIERKGRSIRIDILCNTTGNNLITKRAEGINTARPHWGIWFLRKELDHEPTI